MEGVAARLCGICLDRDRKSVGHDYQMRRWVQVELTVCGGRHGDSVTMVTDVSL